MFHTQRDTWHFFLFTFNFYFNFSQVDLQSSLRKQETGQMQQRKCTTDFWFYSFFSPSVFLSAWAAEVSATNRGIIKVASANTRGDRTKRFNIRREIKQTERYFYLVTSLQSRGHQAPEPRGTNSVPVLWKKTNLFRIKNKGRDLIALILIA